MNNIVTNVLNSLKNSKSQLSTKVYNSMTKNIEATLSSENIDKTLNGLKAFNEDFGGFSNSFKNISRIQTVMIAYLSDIFENWYNSLEKSEKTNSKHIMICQRIGVEDLSDGRRKDLNKLGAIFNSEAETVELYLSGSKNYAEINKMYSKKVITVVTDSDGKNIEVETPEYLEAVKSGKVSEDTPVKKIATVEKVKTEEEKEEEIKTLPTSERAKIVRDNLTVQIAKVGTDRVNARAAMKKLEEKINNLTVEQKRLEALAKSYEAMSDEEVIATIIAQEEAVKVEDEAIF